MDQLTREVRYSKWAEIVMAANNSGLTKAEFCRQNEIDNKSFFYYQRWIRQGLYNATHTEQSQLVELPISEKQEMQSGTVAVIHIGNVSIDISDNISESTLISIGRMVRNAL